MHDTDMNGWSYICTRHGSVGGKSNLDEHCKSSLNVHVAGAVVVVVGRFCLKTMNGLGLDVNIHFTPKQLIF